MTANKLITTELAKIEKLHGVNYEMWHRKIKYALIYDNLEYVIEFNAPELNSNASKVKIKKQKKWKIDDKKARSLIFMFMEDSLINFFETYDTTQSLWNVLKEKYDKTTEINTQLLLQKYNSCKMQEEQSVVEHVNNMVVMAKDLSIVGIPILKKLQVAIILNSLPISFDMVTTSMISNLSLQLSELPTRLGTEQDIMASHRK